MKTTTWMLIASLGAALLSGCHHPHALPPPPQQQVVVPQCTEQWVHMPVTITFATGGAVLDEQNRVVLDEMVRTAMNRQDIHRVRVEGHTDPCGHELDNQALSEARATSVANELVSVGVPANLIETVGHGSMVPRAGNTHTCGEALNDQTNRRVEFTLLVCD